MTSTNPEPIALARPDITQREIEAVVAVMNTPNLCVWRAVFHVPCPGCGVTRSVWLAMHGRFHDAARFYVGQKKELIRAVRAALARGKN